jgi:hypothetical protein
MCADHLGARRLAQHSAAAACRFSREYWAFTRCILVSCRLRCALASVANYIDNTGRPPSVKYASLSTLRCSRPAPRARLQRLNHGHAARSACQQAASNNRMPAHHSATGASLFAAAAACCARALRLFLSSAFSFCRPGMLSLTPGPTCGLETWRGTQRVWIQDMQALAAGRQSRVEPTRPPDAEAPAAPSAFKRR